MLIICSGPDTYRAMRKAQELESAFRTKYDPAGAGIERYAAAKDGITAIVEKSGTISLFSPRRFLRIRGLFDDLPKAMQKPLAAALEKDPEHTIVVTVEQEPPGKTALSPFKDVKVISYDHEELQGKAWEEWVANEAGKVGVQNPDWIRSLARSCAGDSWLAISELQKASAAGPNPLSTLPGDLGAFERADRYLLNRRDRFQDLSKDEATEGMNNILLSSFRSAVRVHDGAFEGVHPYVRQKLSRMNASDWETGLAATLVAFMSSRTGLSREPESSTLYP